MVGHSAANFLAWRLFESFAPRSAIERMSELAVAGDDTLDKSNIARQLRRATKGTKIRDENSDKLLISMQNGYRTYLEAQGLSSDTAMERTKKLASIPGPFSALAISLEVSESSSDWMEYCEFLDKTAGRVASLQRNEQSDTAKLAVLESVAADEYLRWPDYPRVGALTFEQKMVICGINMFLSWIARLDVECTCHWFSHLEPFPLFLPLCPRSINSTDYDNPIKKLVQLLKNIAATEGQKPLPRHDSGERWNRSRLGMQDLLSTRQYHELLVQCGANRPAANTPFSGCGLHLLAAANAFSLLVLRDGNVAQKKVRRRKPASVKSSDDFGERYRFWWDRHRQIAVARGAAIGNGPSLTGLVRV